MTADKVPIPVPVPVPVTVESSLPDLAHPTFDNPSTQPSLIPSPSPPTDKPARIIPDGPKISEPFQFGSRFLLSEDQVFTYNAWDHVETDAAYKAHSAAQLAAQRAKPVGDFDRKRFNDDPAKWWDLFYKNNRENFFKDRKWLQQEFPILAEATRSQEDGGPAAVNIVELGCGAGNTLFPVLQQNKNPGFRIHGADFSAKAIEIVKAQPLYAECFPRGLVSASVYDLSVTGSLPEGVASESVDVVIMVFVFSALSPAQWSGALANVKRMLKPGGKVLFRDYGRGDLAQVRFKAGRYLEENFYVRGDGTRVYFFEQWELRKIFTGEAEKQEGEKVKWVKDENGEGANLEGANLEGTSLEGTSLERTNLERTNLEGTSLGRTNLEGKDLEGTNLEGAGLERTSLERTSSDDEKSSEEKQLKEEIEQLFPKGEFGGFVAREMGVDRRLLVNRKRQLKMYRCWMQAVFEKL